MPITPSCVPHLVPLCLEKVQAGTASSAEGTRQCCRTPEGSWPPGSNKLLCLARGLVTLMGPFSLSSRASEHAPGTPGTQNSNTGQGKIMAYTKVDLGVCSGFLIQELASSLSVPVPAPPAGTGDNSTMQLKHDRDIRTRTTRYFPWGHVWHPLAGGLATQPASSDLLSSYTPA